MVRPIENLRFDQWFRYCLGKPLSVGIGVLTKIRMMNETFAARFQFRSQFAQISLDDVAVRMNERIKTENKID